LHEQVNSIINMAMDEVALEAKYSRTAELPAQSQGSVRQHMASSVSGKQSSAHAALIADEHSLRSGVVWICDYCLYESRDASIQVCTICATPRQVNEDACLPSAASVSAICSSAALALSAAKLALSSIDQTNGVPNSAPVTSLPALAVQAHPQQLTDKKRVVVDVSNPMPSRGSGLASTSAVAPHQLFGRPKWDDVAGAPGLATKQKATNSGYYSEEDESDLGSDSSTDSDREHE
jgi:hypothetical protein